MGSEREMSVPKLLDMMIHGSFGDFSWTEWVILRPDGSVAHIMVSGREDIGL